MPGSASRDSLRGTVLQSEATKEPIRETAIKTLSSPTFSNPIEQSYLGERLSDATSLALKRHLTRMPKGMWADATTVHLSRVSRNTSGGVELKVESSSPLVSRQRPVRTCVTFKRAKKGSESDNGTLRERILPTEAIESQLTYRGRTSAYQEQWPEKWDGIMSDIHRELSKHDLIDKETGRSTIRGTVDESASLGKSSLIIHFENSSKPSPSAASHGQAGPFCWELVGNTVLRRIPPPGSIRTVDAIEEVEDDIDAVGWPGDDES